MGLGMLRLNVKKHMYELKPYTKSCKFISQTYNMGDKNTHTQKNPKNTTKKTIISPSNVLKNHFLFKCMEETIM